jgi:hypothetical protein
MWPPTRGEVAATPGAPGREDQRYADRLGHVMDHKRERNPDHSRNRNDDDVSLQQHGKILGRPLRARRRHRSP